MNKHCDTCNRWEPSDCEIPGVGRCAAVPQVWDATEWDDEGNLALKREFADRLAFVQDASDYRADLFTRASFGCVQHEEKP